MNWLVLAQRLFLLGSFAFAGYLIGYFMAMALEKFKRVWTG